MMSLEKAYLSLQGLSVGDAFGECFFSYPHAMIAQRELPPAPWNWTDDTHMALSIVQVLRRYGEIDQEALAKAFTRRYRQDPYRGYGAGARQLMIRMASGRDWREVAPTLFEGGSYGNGAAMRVAPLGAYFSPDLEQTAEQALLSAEITHAHPEGQVGAIAVAVAAALAAGERRTEGEDFLRQVAGWLPESATRQGIEQAIEIPPVAFEAAVSLLGTGRRISAMDTVPFCLWCAAHNLEDYTKALWQTVAGLGDRDTTCAIVGGIVALSAGEVPMAWVRRREALPPEFES